MLKRRHPIPDQALPTDHVGQVHALRCRRNHLVVVVTLEVIHERRAGFRETHLEIGLVMTAVRNHRNHVVVLSEVRAHLLRRRRRPNRLLVIHRHDLAASHAAVRVDELTSVEYACFPPSVGTLLSPAALTAAALENVSIPSEMVCAVTPCPVVEAIGRATGASDVTPGPT